jgi:hypothetical protein
MNRSIYRTFEQLGKKFKKPRKMEVLFSKKPPDQNWQNLSKDQNVGTTQRLVYN